MLRTTLVFILLLKTLLVSGVSLALDAPNITVSAAGEGKVRITILNPGNVDGFNVYFNQNYKGTYRPVLGTNQFVFDGQSGAYCVASFTTVSGQQQYSPCSRSVNLQSTVPAPSIPGNFRASLYSNTVAELFWDASIDDVLVSRYEVKRDGIVVASLDGRSYFEPSLQNNRSYHYTIVAIDNEDNRSGEASLTLNTSGADNLGPPDSSGDNSPPSRPNNLRGTFYSSTAAEIFWDGSFDNTGIANYEIVRNGQVLDKRNGRSYFDPAVDRSQSYLYEVVAIDFSGNRSEAAQVRLGNGADGGSGDSDQLTLQLQNDRYPLLEGAEAEVLVPISVTRSADNNRNVRLTLRAENASSASQFTYQITPEVLNANQTTATLKVRLGVGVAPINFHERRFIVTARDDNNSVQEKRVIFDVKPVIAPDVYLLVGQSNMEGSSESYAKNTNPGGADELDNRIKQLNVQANSTTVFQQVWQFTDESSNITSPRFIRAEDPLHEPREPGRFLKEATFIGMGLSFAKAALPNTTQEIFLVPAAWSATGFCAGANYDLSWNAEPTPENYLGGTLLADRALTRLNLTLRESGGVFRGILWHQGEADSNNGSCARRYSENLKKLIKRFRTEARVDPRGSSARGSEAAIPLVVGGMSKAEEFGNFNAEKIIVDEVHRNISRYIPHAGFSNHDDFLPPDYPCGAGSCIHFGSRAYREMGDRYYLVLRDIISR